MSEKKKAVMFTDEQLEQVSGGREQYKDSPGSDGTPNAWNFCQSCQRTVYLNESGICTSFNPEDPVCAVTGCDWKPEVDDANPADGGKSENPFL